MVMSESSFVAYVYHRRPVRLHHHQRSCQMENSRTQISSKPTGKSSGARSQEEKVEVDFVECRMVQ